MMPRMHLSITDLPVPEPPMTTSERPRSTGEIDAVEHRLRPEGLADVAELDMGFASCAVTRSEQQRR